MMLDALSRGDEDVGHANCQIAERAVVLIFNRLGTFLKRRFIPLQVFL
jgi:hypothetical protein